MAVTSSSWLLVADPDDDQRDASDPGAGGVADGTSVAALPRPLLQHLRPHQLHPDQLLARHRSRHARSLLATSHHARRPQVNYLALPTNAICPRQINDLGGDIWSNFAGRTVRSSRVEVVWLAVTKLWSQSQDPGVCGLRIPRIVESRLQSLGNIDLASQKQCIAGR